MSFRARLLAVSPQLLGSGRHSRVQKETPRIDPGVVFQTMATRLFQPLGGFLDQAHIDIFPDVDLFLHEAQVLGHVDIAL